MPYTFELARAPENNVSPAPEGGAGGGRGCLQTYPEDLGGEKSGRRRSSKFAAKSLQLPEIYLGM